MSARGAKLVEALAREPLSANIANRRAVDSKKVSRPPVVSEKISASPRQYDLSPTRSTREYDHNADIVIPKDVVDKTLVSDSEHMTMIDDAQDLRSRMDAELIALRRAQSVFADTHPSVDVQGKLQDLQEMYIGDILVRDCQITQLKAENAKLKASSVSVSSTPSLPVAPESNHGRVQSLQRALAAERTKRMDLELRVEDLTRKKDEAVDNQKHLAKLHSAHRLEVSQLKTRLSALQETHKNLQDRFLTDEKSSEVKAPVSPVNTDKISYVKYASLRAEKKQVEARLQGEVDRLKLAVEMAKADRESEFEKQTVHQKRIVAELERKLRILETCKSEEAKELKELKQSLNQTLCKKEDLENQVLDLKIERDNLCLEISKLKENEKFLTLELEHVNNSSDEESSLRARIDEREDLIRQLQEEVGQLKEHVAAGAELDELLIRAEEDVTHSRQRIVELEDRIAELEDQANHEISKQGQEVDLTKQTSSQTLQQVDQTKQSHVRHQVEQPKQSSSRTRQEVDQPNKPFESIQTSPTRQPQKYDRGKKFAEKKRPETFVDDEEDIRELPQLVDKKFKSLSKLEKELAGMRASIALNGSSDSAESFKGFAVNASSDESFKGFSTAATAMATPVASHAVSHVGQIENKFHQAVELCADQQFEDAVLLLEEASLGLSKLSQGEILKTDSEVLKVLESDIYGQLGVAFQSLSQIPEAIDSYATAVHIDPEAHACHANLAVLLNHVSRRDEAEKHARMASKLAPSSAEYTHLLDEILAPW